MIDPVQLESPTLGVGFQNFIMLQKGGFHPMEEACPFTYGSNIHRAWITSSTMRDVNNNNTS
jgi:hypothetical protein